MLLASGYLNRVVSCTKMVIIEDMRMLCAAMTMSSHPCWTFSKRSVLALFASTTTLDRVKATQGEHTQTPHSLNTTQNEQPQCLIINV